MYCTQLCPHSFQQFRDMGVWPGPTISLHRMCFPGNFSQQSQQQPKAPGLSVDFLCSPGPWSDRHHLPLQHNPLWLFCILWWDWQDKGGDETSWARPTLVSPIHTTGDWPWQDHLAELASKIIWLEEFSGATQTKKCSFCTQPGQGKAGKKH